MEQQTTSTNTLIKNLLIVGVIGGVLYLLYRRAKGKKSAQRVLEEKTMSEAERKSKSSSMVKQLIQNNPTFKQQVASKDTDNTSYGQAQATDSLKIGNNFYHIYFYSWVAWPRDGSSGIWYRVMALRQDKGNTKYTGKVGDSVLIGEWDLSKTNPKKITLRVAKSTGNYKTTRDRVNSEGSTYSGTISDVIGKATGEKVTLDGYKLAK